GSGANPTSSVPPSPSGSPSPSPCVDRSKLETQTTQIGTLLNDAVSALRGLDLTSAASDFSSAADLTDSMATQIENLIPDAAGEFRASAARLRSAATELSRGGIPDVS